MNDSMGAIIRLPFIVGSVAYRIVSGAGTGAGAVLKEGGKKKLLHTFVQKMKGSGHVGVFGRIKRSKMKKKNKEKIYEIKSPAAAIMATNEKVAPPNQKAIDNMFMKRLDHEVERLLKIK